MKRLLSPLAAVATVLCLSVQGQASLVEFQSYNGNVGLSSDGFGSLSNSGIITANAASGSTVLAAYLYTATYSFNATPNTVSFEGNNLT